MKSPNIPLWIFTDPEVKILIENCNFSELQEQIFILRNRDVSNIAVAQKLNISESTVSYQVKKIKHKIYRALPYLNLAELKDTY